RIGFGQGPAYRWAVLDPIHGSHSTPPSRSPWTRLLGLTLLLDIAAHHRNLRQGQKRALAESATLGDAKWIGDKTQIETEPFDPGHFIAASAHDLVQVMRAAPVIPVLPPKAGHRHVMAVENQGVLRIDQTPSASPPAQTEIPILRSGKRKALIETVEREEDAP